MCFYTKNIGKLLYKTDLENKGEKTVSFECDSPIKTEEEDLLGRTPFAKSFAKGMVDLSQESNFIVSLNGPWGSGKTSLINLVQKEIIRIRDYEDINSYPIIINFAPWNTLDQNSIITQFFNCFLSSFNDVKIKKALRKFIKSKYTKGIVEIAKQIPSLDAFLKTIQKLFCKYFKSFLEDDNKDLYSIKDDLTRRLLYSPYKYIVFIDDLDRLNNHEIRLIIQLVKAVCNFPNVIYVLSFDKKIVANALTQEQTADGEKYLEKIIQLPIDLPSISRTSLNEYLFNKIENVVTNITTKDFDSNRWQSALSSGYLNLFNNMRDVNRYVNAIKFKLASLRDNIDIVDLLIIEALRIFEPNLLEFLYENRKTIVPHANSFTYHRKKQIEEFNKKALKISPFSSLLSCMFPLIYTFGEYSTGESSVQLKIRGRICVEENFYTYFQTNLTDNTIKLRQVEEYLKNDNEQSRQEFLLTLNNKQYFQFLESLYGYIKDGKFIENIKSRYLELINVDYGFDDLTKLFGARRIFWFEHITSEMVKSFGEIQFKDYFIQIIKKTKNYGLIISLMYFLAKGTAFYFDKKSDELLLTQETVETIDKVLLECIKRYSDEMDFINNKTLLGIIRYLIRRDKAFVIEWYKNNGKDMFAILEKMVSLGYGESNKRFILYFFNHSCFDEFVDTEILTKNIIDDLQQSIIIDSYDRLCKILFLMPKKEDGYQLEEIFDYCRNNQIAFSYTDKFIDE